MSRKTIGVLALVAGLAALNSCRKDSTESETSGDLSDPAVLEAVIRETFLEGAVGVLEATDRLLVALSGGTADGVSIIPNANGADAQISVDFNGDGSREGTINAQLVGAISLGASLSVSSIDAPLVPSLVASGGAVVTETSPGVVVIDNLFGSGGTNDVGVTVTGGNLSVDLVSAYPFGGFSLLVSGEGEALPVNVGYASDGQGGFLTRFSGPGFDFTIP